MVAAPQATIMKKHKSPSTLRRDRIRCKQYQQQKASTTTSSNDNMKTNARIISDERVTVFKCDTGIQMFVSLLQTLKYGLIILGEEMQPQLQKVHTMLELFYQTLVRLISILLLLLLLQPLRNRYPSRIDTHQKLYRLVFCMDKWNLYSNGSSCHQRKTLWYQWISMTNLIKDC